MGPMETEETEAKKTKKKKKSKSDISVPAEETPTTETTTETTTEITTKAATETTTETTEETAAATTEEAEAVAEPQENKTASDTTQSDNTQSENSQSEDTSDTTKPKKEKKLKKNQSFRRVIEEDVFVPADKADNSFDAKIGARGDWGEKANEDLRFTKGKSFRHEKTKKKRGSYRGGAINVSVNSIKFSDDEE